MFIIIKLSVKPLLRMSEVDIINPAFWGSRGVMLLLCYLAVSKQVS